MTELASSIIAAAVETTVNNYSASQARTNTNVQ
jgi:hypothetical protein